MRTNNDEWTITSSVGRTALLVALGRALETRSPSPLISDPFAAEFVADAGEADLAPDRVETLAAAGDASVARSVDLLQTMMAARTMRIDSALSRANDDGCLQVVLLAAGLDARAHRLDWRPGTSVYEVDQPAVLEFKAATLDRLGAQPRAARVTVAVDLRDDWLPALRAAGLDTDRPIAWLAEGLLPYLRAEDQTRLLTTIGTAAPTGSVLVLDAPREPFDASAVDAETFGVSMDELFLDTGQFAAQEWLDENGWATTSDSIGALLTAYGRSSAVFTAPSGGEGFGDAFDIVVARRRG